MAKLNIRTAILVACFAAGLSVPVSAHQAVAQTTDSVCTGAKWDTCNFEQRLAVVKNFCDTTGVSLKDNDKTRLAKAKKSDFLGFFGCDDRDEPLEVAQAPYQGPVVIRHQPPHQHYRSFDSVAADSLKVRSHGKNYNLRNLGGDVNSCPPPRKWHRTEQCRPIGNGGIRCQMVCQ